MERSEWTPKVGEMVGVVPVAVDQDGIMINGETFQRRLSLCALHRLSPAMTPEAAAVLEAADAWLDGNGYVVRDLTNAVLARRAKLAPPDPVTRLTRAADALLEGMCGNGSRLTVTAEHRDELMAALAAAKAKDAGHE